MTPRPGSKAESPRKGVANDHNLVSDVFIYDLFGRSSERISVAFNGGEANGANDSVSLSAAGRFAVPAGDEGLLWNVPVSAGATVTDRDFGFRELATGGQFENAVLRGRLFQDDNGNGQFDEAVGEAGLAGWTVFLDTNHDGVRQYDEQWTATSLDDPGAYSFTGRRFQRHRILGSGRGQLPVEHRHRVCRGGRRDIHCRGVSVHLNTLVGGAHRVTLTGVETVTGQDFGLQPLNASPTLDAIPDPPAVNEDAGVEQRVPLSGITAGDGESQPLAVTAASDNPALLASVTVAPTSSGSSGTLRYTLADDPYGTPIVTVTVTDAGLDGELSTTADNGSCSRSFTVRVNPLNDPPALDPIPDQPPIDEGSPTQTVHLAGISAGGGESQPLRVTATAPGNPSLFAEIAVEYDSPDTSGTLRYTPAPHQSGTAVVVVTVTDGGLDGKLDTPGDNLSLSRAFAVTVRAVIQTPTTRSLARLPPGTSATHLPSAG